MMNLREARVAFTYALATLVVQAKGMGYDVAFGEGMDRITEKDPTTDHMKGSLHEIGLAMDIDLYKNGIYQSRTEDHKSLGEWWEGFGKAMNWPLAWGGRFKDGNHYSFGWEGKK